MYKFLIQLISDYQASLVTSHIHSSAMNYVIEHHMTHDYYIGIRPQMQASLSMNN